jgi:N6-adenosine-specific RNA methylase IME4
MGYTLRSATEHLIVARRGHPKVNDRSVSTWFEAKRMRHSQKPEEARNIIEKICFGDRIELFARQQTEGWDVWGNDVESDIELFSHPTATERT